MVRFGSVVTALVVSANAREVAEPLLCCGWADENAALPSSVRFTVQVREIRLERLQQVATEVSDPKSPNYGKFLLQAEIDEMTAPRSADVDAVRSWLSTFDGAKISVTKDRLFTVECSLQVAAARLSTTFRMLGNSKTKQRALRASDYEIPGVAEDSVQAIFGLHGLPAPPKKHVDVAEGTAAVTPSIINAQYRIGGVAASRSEKNRQAVAEFQGQTMNSTDLARFFEQYVPDAVPGDEVVSKFVGDYGDSKAQVEASLDVQYIMGVAPGIKTEFWLYKAMDFCADLKQWTTQMLADDDCPWVHSVSYGYQGNHTHLCSEQAFDAIEADFVKLAAKGISIIFASGDSGSGYTPPSCYDKAALQDDTEVVGTVTRVLQTQQPEFCCNSRDEAFTFEPPANDGCSSALDGVAFEGKILSNSTRTKDSCCERAKGYSESKGWSWSSNGGSKGTCLVFYDITGNQSDAGSTSAKTVFGTCTLFSNITGTRAKPGVQSGGPWLGATMWPSWPASSPWVTAVGSTRFVNQRPGEEMATDQFGSGGGFSWDFAQPEWQKTAVANFFEVASKEAPFPPDSSFPSRGRTTPDVAALGEGFQVINGGRLLSVGGTSASAPAFAGIVSLLNEARMQQGLTRLGFLNPWLYQQPGNHTDVVKGWNALGRSSARIKYGFNCTPGWDPVSGLGSPRFDALLSSALDSAVVTLV